MFVPPQLKPQKVATGKTYIVQILMYVLSTFTNLTLFLFVMLFQLLQELKKVNFTLEKRQIYFDKSSFATGYELINWMKRANRRHFEIIGEYDMLRNAFCG